MPAIQALTDGTSKPWRHYLAMSGGVHSCGTRSTRLTVSQHSSQPMLPGADVVRPKSACLKKQEIAVRQKPVAEQQPKNCLSTCCAKQCSDQTRMGNPNLGPEQQRPHQTEAPVPNCPDQALPGCCWGSCWCLQEGPLSLPLSASKGAQW